MITTSISRKKRIRNIFSVLIILCILLVIRVAWIQFFQGEELQTKAYSQQSLDRNISPKRGTILDATGKIALAVSVTCETVTINPMNIKEADKEKLAKAFCNIFDLDYESTFKKVNKKSSIEVIIKKQEKEKTNLLRSWLKENNIETGVNIDEDTKRVYPYNSLASQVIGFCGIDNQGLDGIESKFDHVLKGSNGKIERLTDAQGKEIKYQGEDYVAPINGKDIVVSIDMTIQAIAEKYLEKACIDNQCTDGGNMILMNPNTGDILAMATYPKYNLNEPYEPNMENLKAIWNGLNSQEKTKELQKMWRNTAIADTYEPGSTFKIVTASAALEEGITQVDRSGEFYCTGGIEVAGVRIKCWRYYRPHGAESLREALMNSCNPIFVGLGQKLGVSKYYSYLNKFGLLKITGIDLPGEAGSIFISEKKAGPVELATISFGQRFKITPIQLARTVCTIANGGNLIKPRIVKQIIDTKTGEIQEIGVENLGRAISEKTANDVLSMMESVVSAGTGKNSSVKGYRIAGKTGTSEDGVNTNKYVTSFIGVAPVEKPQVVMLVTLYNPTGEAGHQGGGVAAPIGAEVFSEVLPYLNILADTTEDKQEIQVPDVRNKTIAEAKKQLKELGLEISIPLNEGEQITGEEVIKEQFPKPGIKIKSTNKVEIYYK